MTEIKISLPEETRISAKSRQNTTQNFTLLESDNNDNKLIIKFF